MLFRKLFLSEQHITMIIYMLMIKSDGILKQPFMKIFKENLSQLIICQNEKSV